MRSDSETPPRALSRSVLVVQYYVCRVYDYFVLTTRRLTVWLLFLYHKYLLFDLIAPYEYCKRRTVQ